MKIALISAANSIHTQRWAVALKKRGHDVSVISCVNHACNRNELYRLGIRFKVLKIPAPLGYYLNAAELHKFIKKEEFDIINVHYASGYGTLGRKAGLKNALLNIWGSDVYEYPYKSKINMITIKKNLSFYKYIASTSKCMAKQAKRLVPLENVYLTPFGVDVDLFKPIDGLKDNDKFLFGTVKTLSPKYGIEDSINAFMLLYQRLQTEGKSLAEKISYEIYGKGELKEYLQNLIERKGFSDKIKLMGYVENSDLPNIINRFDVFAVNSISDSESFGVAAVEAMACGVPCIVSDADGLKEVVSATGGGIIVLKKDIYAISNAMYDLLMNEEKRQELGKAGYYGVRQLYDWSYNVDEMLAIYARMMHDKIA